MKTLNLSGSYPGKYNITVTHPSCAKPRQPTIHISKCHILEQCTLKPGYHLNTLKVGTFLIKLKCSSKHRSLASSKGFVTIAASCPNNDMNLSVKYDMDENLIGTIELESRNLPIAKTFTSTVTFDVGKPDKQINIDTK